MPDIVIDDALLDRAIELSEKATPGPWEFEDRPHRQDDQCGCVVVRASEDLAGHELFDTFNRGYKESMISRDGHDEKFYDLAGGMDLEFCAFSRTALPAIARALKEARMEVEQLRATIELLQLRGSDAYVCLLQIASQLGIEATEVNEESMLAVEDAIERLTRENARLSAVIQGEGTLPIDHD